MIRKFFAWYDSLGPEHAFFFRLPILIFAAWVGVWHVLSCWPFILFSLTTHMADLIWMPLAGIAYLLYRRSLRNSCQSLE